MKISRSARLCWIVAWAATCPLVGARAAGEPEEVAPIQFGAPRGQTGTGTSVAPVGGAALRPSDEAVAPVGFSLNNTARDVALAQIKAGALTLEAAWQSGALTYQNIADLLENEADVYLIHYEEGSDGLHHRLISLLLQHEGARMAELSQVPQRVRLWLADYYQGQGNVKAVEVAQSILNQAKAPVPGDSALLFQAIERIGWFYRDSGQHEKEAQVWLRVLPLLARTASKGDLSWMLPDALIGAARAYSALGEQDKARELYAQVPQYEDAWLTGLTIYDQANALIQAHGNQESRILLQQYLSEGKSTPIQVALFSLLSWSYWKTGEVDLAQNTAHKAISSYRSLADPPHGLGIEEQVRRAREIITLCQLYRTGLLTSNAPN